MEKTKAELIRDAIVKEITSGKLRPGQKMYGMRELAARFNVSFAVVNSAYNQLAGENLIIRKNRSGTYVNPSPAVNPAKAIALLTTYRISTIENYFEPMLDLAGRNKIVPIIGPPLGEEDSESILNSVMSRSPDGVLIDCTCRDEQHLETIFDYIKDVPYCFVDRWEAEIAPPANSVLIDYAAGYAEAIKYFMSCGNINICVIGHGNCIPKTFYEKLEFAFRANNLEFDESSYIGIHSPETTMEGVLDFFRRKKPDAILATTDYLVEVLNLILKDASPILNNMNIIGMYNLHYSRVRGREFSSIAPDFHAMWKRAFKLLDNPANSIEYVKPEIIFR